MTIHTAIAAPSADTSAWNALSARYAAARAEHDHHHEAVWTPLAAQLDREAPRPDLFFEIEALSGAVARYNVSANDLHCWDDHWSPLYRRKAAAVRDAWLIYRAASEWLGMDEVDAEDERLCNQWCAIESELLAMPAPDVDALGWKLERLFGTEAMADDDAFAPAWCREWIDALMADARRLLHPQPVAAVA